MSSNIKTTLNRLFLRVMTIGFATLILVALLLIHQGQQRDAEQWRSDTISKSAALTASYYSRLTTQVILDRQSDIKTLLHKIQIAEKLTMSRVITQEALSSAVLRTCKVEATSAYFYEVPTCVEIIGRHLKIYHELRSAGFGVGYLLKEIPIPDVGLWGDSVRLRNMALILGCFILLYLVKLYHLKKFIMMPTKLLINSLKENRRIDFQRTDYKLVEWQTLAETLQNSLDATAAYQQKAKTYEFEAKIGQMASQVAHDIRSPLAALTMATSHLQELPEDTRLLVRSAVQRIHDIANDLAGKKAKASDNDVSSSAKNEPSLQLLSGIVDTLVSEKRLQYRAKINIEIDAELGESSYGLFAKIQPVEFKRVLSNLINNAVEVLPNGGRVGVKLHAEGDTVKIHVSDTGQGIPPEILSKLMQRGETHGKVGGSGLGLYHARVSAESWGGGMAITSTIGLGTTITVTLPKHAPPEWFVPELRLTPQSTVVILDDDNSIHQIWKGRFESADPEHLVKLIHFSSPKELATWQKEEVGVSADTVILCDYEFIGQAQNGIDIIRQLGIAEHAILVTSRFEEDFVRRACEELGVRLIPKNLAGFVPINIGTSIPQHVTINSPDIGTSAHQHIGTNPDAILIDDDELVHMNWKMTAKRKNKILRVYTGPEEFWKDSNVFAKDTPIYVDSNLGGGVKGEDITWLMGKKGYGNLFLATGINPKEFDAMPWVKGIVGKNPPWP